MKHQYTALSLLVVLGTVAPLLGVSAETGTNITATTTRKTEFKAAIESKQQNLEDARKNIKDEVKQNKEVQQDFRAEIAQKQVANVIRVLTATANRLDGLVARIESRIQKIKTAGGTTATAEASVALAKIDILGARTHISAIGALDLNGASTTAKTNFDKIKTEAKAVKDGLTSAHQNLAKAVSSLKGSEKGLNTKRDREQN